MCYSALHTWRATVANLKKKIGDREAVGGVFLCEQWLFSPKFRDSQPAGDALNYYFKLHVLQVTRESGK